jgi:NADP-dependent 3-hydroxy acid dehydrogenase YdfG
MHGYKLVLAARRLERLQKLAQEIDAVGGRALPVKVDVSSEEDIQAMVQQALYHFGQVDILFNNAGYGRLDWLENCDPLMDIENQFRVNLIGVIQTTRAILPQMIARRSGHIINMASLAGFVAAPTYSIYAASKFAVRGFSEALRREVGVWNIHVSAIYPGAVKTEFSEHTGSKRKSGVTTPESLRLTAGDVAQAVFHVIQRPRRALILPWPMRFSIWANTLFPGLVDWIIEQKFTRPERGL